LQNDTNLANRAELELKEAETAVLLAEQPLPTTEASLGAHRVFMADRKVEIARAEATTAYTEDQRKRYAKERNAARLAARTREADQARDDADYARADASRARDETYRAQGDANRAQGEAYRAQDDANQARDDAALAQDSADRAREDASQARSATDAAKAAAATDAARQATQMQQQIDDANRASKAADAAKATAANDAARHAAELQRQIDVLEAETTDRGLVLTLGDVLFTTGSAELQAGASTRLDKLVGFLNQYPERRVLIEGHTDNVGDADYNQGLSQRRADSVQAYLTRQGIEPRRLTASGMGLRNPITGNDSAAGRQQNRRVEIIIENPPLATASASLE
jgi:outer membrane protein OmpA-like peptidoglycan-associated protein